MSHFTRFSHQQRFIPPTTSTNYYQKSFFPHTIADWNNLPDEIIDSTTLDEFLYHLKIFLVNMYD